MYRLLWLALVCLVVLSQQSFAALRTFSVGEELTQLYIPEGMCVLSEAAAFKFVDKSSMGKNSVLAVFVPCSLVEGAYLSALPDIWGMWLTQSQVIPSTVSRKTFIDGFQQRIKQRSDAKLLGTDDNALYTLMQIAGRSDAVDAIVAVSKLNNRPVTLNLYKNYSSSNPTNLLELARTVMGRTFAEQPKEARVQSPVEQVTNKAILGGVSGLMFGLLVAGFALIGGIMTKITRWIKRKR